MMSISYPVKSNSFEDMCFLLIRMVSPHQNYFHKNSYSMNPRAKNIPKNMKLYWKGREIIYVYNLLSGVKL